MTSQQLIVKFREKHPNKKKAPKFGGAPHRKGVIYKIAVMSPRKPNSANVLLQKYVYYEIINVFLQKYQVLVNIFYKLIL